MRRYAVCGDIHWSTYSSIIRKRGRKYSQRLERLIKSVNWFEKLAKDNKCDEEIFLGDTFDRSDLNAEELTALQDVKWNKLPKYFIVGNHESNINTLEFSSTKFFESINANVISKATKLEISDDLDFYLIPYITTDKTLELSDYIDVKDNKRKIVFAHQDLAGLQYGRFLSQSGFAINDIKNNCELFFDGHLHNEQIIADNIILVGILSGQNFNEDALKFRHLAYILTIDDNGRISYEAYENPEAFNFYKLRIENKKDFDILDSLKDNAVVSVVCEESLVKELSRLIKKNKKITESRIVMFYNYSSDNSNTTNILVDDYIKQFILLAQDKLEKTSILNSELARLGGD